MHLILWPCMATFRHAHLRVMQAGVITAVSGLQYPEVRGGVASDATPELPRLQAPPRMSGTPARTRCLRAVRRVTVGGGRGGVCAVSAHRRAAVLSDARCSGLESLTLLHACSRQLPEYSTGSGASGRGRLMLAPGGIGEAVHAVPLLETSWSIAELWFGQRVADAAVLRISIGRQQHTGQRQAAQGRGTGHLCGCLA